MVTTRLQVHRRSLLKSLPPLLYELYVVRDIEEDMGSLELTIGTLIVIVCTQTSLFDLGRLVTCASYQWYFWCSSAF
jgi:hypothetical protein